MTDEPTHQPTNDQPDVPTFYVSLRITINHSEWENIKASVLHDCDYVAFPHRGHESNNPHFHIFVPAGDKKVSEKLRKRVKDKLSISGNERFSCQYRGNGILHAITYGSKEGTTAYVSSSAMQNLVQMAPEWIQRDKGIGGYMKAQSMGREPNPDHFKLITPRNIEKVTLRYRQNNGIKSVELEDTLEAMHLNGWRLAECFLRNGIMSSIFESFTASCRGKQHWTSGKFLFLKRDVYDHKRGP